MEKLLWTTEQRRVRDLIPLEFNPRKVNAVKQQQLIESFKAFDLVEIPVVNRDNHIIAGERRFEVLWYNGKQDDLIDVRVPNRMLTEEEVKKYCLISNTHSGEWDLVKLEEHFAEINYQDIISLPDLKTDLPSAEVVMSKPETEEQKEVVEDEFDEPLPVDPVTKPGDFYELNGHRLLCADSTDMRAVERSQHELIFVYKNGRGKHINNFELGQGGRYRTNVWQYAGMNSVGNRERESLEDHPTVKPVKLVADAILDCSNKHGLVLDLFLGSGTTIIASEQTDRVCYGVEMDEKYCDTIIRRYLRFMKQYGLPVCIKKNGVELTPDELLQYA